MPPQGDINRLTPTERLALNTLIEWGKSGCTGYGPEYHHLALAAHELRRSERAPLITADTTLWLVTDDDTVLAELDPALPTTAAGRSIVLHPDGTWEEG